MKSISKLIAFCLLSFVVLSSCKKEYQEDTYDFSNSLSPYVELKAKTAVSVQEGKSFNVTAQVRVALQEVTEVNYSITGGLTRQGVIRIERNAIEGTVTILVPAGTIPVGSTTATATLNLSTAKTPTSSLLVGRLGTEKEKVTINIKK